MQSVVTLPKGETTFHKQIDSGYLYLVQEKQTWPLNTYEYNRSNFSQSTTDWSSTVWCHYNAVSVAKILTIDTPMGEVWGAFCQYKFWCM